MTFSLPRKRRTTRPARSTPSRTASRLLAAAAWLALAGGAAAQAPVGQPRSTFVPRTDAAKPGPTGLVLPVQAKGGTGQPSTTPGTTTPMTPGTAQPGTTQPGTTAPQPGKGTLPGTVPGSPTTPIPGVPGLPGGTPPIRPGAGAGTGGPLDAGGAGTSTYEEYIRLDPPGKERLFGSRDTERELEERMRQERRDADMRAQEEGRTPQGPVVFPDKPELTAEPYQARRFAPIVCLAEPSYVVYRRLYFEEKNAERYGWDLGPIQPIVSTLCFLKDVALWPHNFASDPCRRFETNAGECLPGDPVPYLLYPPEFTATGLLAEAGVVGLLFYAVP